jgi:thiol-disulfide isomerase/thioredoxin
MSVITSDRMRRACVAWALGALAAAVALPALAGGPPGVGDPMPPLVGRSFAGEAFDIANWRGQVIVLNFWASWCEPCRAEMPALDALQRDYRDAGVVVIGLSADDRHDRGDALQASKVVGYTTGMLAETTANGFGPPQMLPLTYVIDRAGVVSAVLRANRGALDVGQLRSAVDRALATAIPDATH